MSFSLNDNDLVSILAGQRASDSSIETFLVGVKQGGEHF